MGVLILAWVAFFGVWPLAHPPHDASNITSSIDLAAHLFACVGLDYVVVRRILLIHSRLE